MPNKSSVLFVCLGNICRSPMAEGVFRSLLKEDGNDALIDRVDSCGTGAYHAGDEPDSRTLSTLEDHGITDYEHYARKIQLADFDKFDYIFTMDRSNTLDVKALQRRRPGKAVVMLFGEYGGKGKGAEEVDDPYYGGRNGFDAAYEQCRRFSKRFLEELRAKAGGYE